MSRSGLVVASIVAALALSVMPPVAAEDAPTEEATAVPGPRALGQVPEWIDLGVLAAAGVQSEIDETRWYAEPVEETEGRPEPAMVVRRGDRSSGAVALTFDDGYNGAACASIARTLRENDAVGTFFINGSLLKRDPQKWRRILGDMPVGNHTRSHRLLTREPHRVVRKQIKENEAIHERVLGRPMLKVLRPPYGAYGERVGRIATELGYDHVVFWSVDTQDWKRGSSARKIVRRATRAGPGSIILMHCARNATAKALPAIIRSYQARGIKLAGLDDVLRGLEPDRRPSVPKEYGSS